MNCLTRSSSRQCCCLLCGTPQILANTECPVDQEMRDALIAFADSNGRQWKSAMLHHWQNSQRCDPVILRLRNVLGPTQLLRITQATIELLGGCPVALKSGAARRAHAATLARRSREEEPVGTGN